MKTFLSELPSVFASTKSERKEAVTKAEVLASLKEYTKQMFPFNEDLFRGSAAASYPPLSRFVDSIMKQTQTPLFILILALLYLTRLKTFHPGCRGSPGSSHRLLFTAIIIASKYTCDDTYDNNAWATASNGLFSNEETNRMEREMLQYLQFKIFVERSDWDSHLVSFIYTVKDLIRHVKLVHPVQDEYIEIVPPRKPGILRQISSSSTMFDPEEDTNTNPPYIYPISSSTIHSCSSLHPNAPISICSNTTSIQHSFYSQPQLNQTSFTSSIHYSSQFHHNMNSSSSSHPLHIPPYLPTAVRQQHSSDHFLSPVSSLPSIP